MGIQSILKNITGYNQEVDSYQILDDIYSHNAIILQDAVSIFNIDTSSPLLSAISGIEAQLPLIGLSYKLGGEMELLKYEHSQYPYLSKLIISNASIKQPTRFQLEVYSIVNADNPVAINIFRVQNLIDYLDKYARAGGLFTILTMFGMITDCQLDEVLGVPVVGEIDGSHLKMMFTKNNISSVDSVTNNLTALLEKVAAGGTPGGKPI